MNLDNFWTTIEGKSEEESKQILEDFRLQPIYGILMFKKMINNHLKNRGKIKVSVEVIDKSEPEDKLAILDRAAYRKAFSYISKIDLDRKDIKDLLLNHKDQIMINSIDNAVGYFSSPSVEDYEKCSFLMKMKGLMK